MKRVLAVMLLLAFALCAVAAQAAPMKLEYKFKQGEVSKYKLSMSMKMSMSGMPSGAPGPTNMKMTADITEKVLAVNKDGSAKVQMSISNCKMSVPGMPPGQAPQIPDETMTMTMSKDGKILKMEGTGQMMGGLGMAGAGQGSIDQTGPYGVLLPKKSVNVGETWKQSIPIPTLGGSMNIVSKLQSASVPLGKTTVCKIKQTYKGRAKSGTDISGSTVFHFSPAQGKLLKSSGTAKVKMSQTPPASAQQKGAAKMSMVMDMTMTITKVD